jgi:hypothetical protein
LRRNPGNHPLAEGTKVIRAETEETEEKVLFPKIPGFDPQEDFLLRVFQKYHETSAVDLFPDQSSCFKAIPMKENYFKRRRFAPGDFL